MLLIHKPLGRTVKRLSPLYLKPRRLKVRSQHERLMNKPAFVLHRVAQWQLLNPATWLKWQLP